MIHYSRLISGFQKFVDREIVAQSAGSLHGFVTFIAGFFIAERGEAVFKWLSDKELAKAAHFVNGENVDAELLFRAMAAYFQQYGSFSFTIPGVNLMYTFSQNDVIALERYVKE